MSSKGKKINNTNCSVPGCHSRKGRESSVHFHYFPKKKSCMVKIQNAFGQEENTDVRKAWEKVLLMGKPVTKYMRVCSKHFTREDYLAHGVQLKRPKLKKYAVPSQCLPKRKQYGESSTNKPGTSKDSTDLRTERRIKRLKVSSSPILEVAMCEEVVPEVFSHESIKKRELGDLQEEERVVVQNLLALSTTVDCKFVDKEVQVKSGDLLVTFASTITTDSQLNSLTGIRNFSLLDSLAGLITEFYPDKKQHKLYVKDRLILVFMKLKMAIRINILSFLFKISAPLCKKIIEEYIGYLAKILSPCIHWPSFQECQENMPICFKNFKSVRVVLDCIEIPIEKPKCLCCRIRTYSHYKGRETLKIMTGISPAGLITFLSKSYGGRSSDKAIFTQSKLILKVQPRQDSLMVDKGFLIDDICSQNFINIFRPHFLRKKKQFTESESKDNLNISRARVHIERVNQRMRIFSILNTPLPNTFIHLIDDIMIIICGIVNLQTPILAEDKF